jgi:hypothetical protein
MPDVGEQVTVRALWPMPGIAEGAAVTVSWGPQLAALVDAGRYELLPDADATTAGAGPGGQADDEAAGSPGSGEAVDDRPGRRQRAR